MEWDGCQEKSNVFEAYAAYRTFTVQLQTSLPADEMLTTIMKWKPSLHGVTYSVCILVLIDSCLLSTLST